MSEKTDIGLSSSANRINIKYNTYTYQVKIDNEHYDKGASQCKDIIIANNGSSRIGEWFAEFLLKIYEDLNEDFTIYLESTDIDIEIVGEIIVDFNRKEKRYFAYESKSVTLTDTYEDILIVLDSLKKSTNEEVENGIATNEIKFVFDNFKNNEVSIAVVATVSAGKSTLLNTFLGTDLMPAKNEPCTATICEIRNNNLDNYFGELVDMENQVIKEKREIDSEIIAEYNKLGNEQFLKINIEGKIENLAVKGVSLVLIDTPGPNNSVNEIHKEITYTLIRDRNKNPLIIYVLNCQNLKVKDDKDFLNEISDTLKEHGKKAYNRILFVLNKIDSLEPEKEDLKVILENCQKYLKDNGIQNAKIFPISSRFANLTMKETETLNRTETGDLYNYKNKILPDFNGTYLGYDTIRYAPIPQYLKDKFHQESKEDAEKASLHYSGFSALKYYLEKHIEENHKIEMIHGILEVIAPLLNKVISVNRKILNNSNEEIEKQKKDLLEFQEFFSDQFNEEKKKLLLAINNLKIDKTFYRNLKYKTDVNFQHIRQKLQNDKIGKEDFITIKNKTEAIISNLQISLKTSLKDNFDFTIKNTSKNINSIIINTFSSLIKDSSLSEDSIENYISEVTLLINEEQYESKVKKFKEYKDKSSLFFRWFGWGKEKKEAIYEDVVYVNGIKIYNEYFSPLQNKINEDLEESKKVFTNKINEITTNGLKVVEDIEIKIKEKQKIYGDKAQSKFDLEQHKKQLERQIEDLNFSKNILSKIGNENG